VAGSCPTGYAGGQTYIGIIENNFTDADQRGYGLLEQILSPTNLNEQATSTFRIIIGRSIA
jgi:hypothetical protein